MIDGVSVHAGAVGNQRKNLAPDAPQKTCRRLARAITRLAGKNAAQIVIKISRPFEGVLSSLALVMFAQRQANLGQPFNLAAHAIFWPRAGDLFQQLVNEFQFLLSVPAAVPSAPIRPR